MCFSLSIIDKDPLELLGQLEYGVLKVLNSSGLDFVMSSAFKQMSTIIDDVAKSNLLIYNGWINPFSDIVVLIAEFWYN